MKKLLVGGIGFVGGVIVTIYTLASIYAWKTYGLQDYVRAHRKDQQKATHY